MKWIGHRGYSLEYKDNSIEAIRQAVVRGYDGVEIDIQLCKTGEIVLHHDVYLGDRFIKDAPFDDLDVISLDDVYREIPEISDVPLLLDIKGNDHSIIQALEIFYRHRSIENVTFCSFNRSLLFGLPSNFKKGSTFETSFKVGEYDMITQGITAVLIHWTCLSREFIKHCHAKNITLYTYTHKEQMELEYMYTYEVDAIITNGFTSYPGNSSQQRRKQE